MANRIAKQNGRLFVELGQTGLNHHSGIIDDEFLNQLKGNRAVKVYREMSENDPTIGTALSAFDTAIRQIEWRLEPPPEEDERSDLIWTAMHDMSISWRDFISDVLTMLPYGWSYFEIVYKRREGLNPERPGEGSRFDDGLIGWRKFAIRNQESLDHWEMDPNGGIRGLWQRPAPDYNLIFIPIEKSLLFRTVVRGNNPEGRSMLRNAYVPWYRKKRIEEIEAVGAERDLAGFPLFRVPAEILDANADAQAKAAYKEIKRIGRNIRNDEQGFLVLPSDMDPETKSYLWDFELVSAGAGRRMFDTLAIRQRYAIEILNTFLAAVLELGHQQVGSYSLASEMTNLLTMSIKAITDQIVETFNRHAITRLLILNNMDIEEMPELSYGDIETVDAEKITRAILNLSQAGHDVLDDETQNDIREKIGLPQRESFEVEDLPVTQAEPMPEDTEPEEANV